MNKLHTILAGTAIALFSQFAAAQSTQSAPARIVVPESAAPTNPNDPAYTDQSRLNYTNDPYIKKRISTKGARDEYRADKNAAKEEYRDARRDAKDVRKQELNSVPPIADPASGR